jgi:hypothetical protein
VRITRVSWARAICAPADLCAGTERVAVDRGDRDGGKREHAAHHGEHAVEVFVDPLPALGEHPVHVQTVRVELPRSGRDQRLRCGRLLHLVEGVVPRAHEARVEAVLAGIHAQHEDVTITREIDHRNSVAPEPRTA